MQNLFAIFVYISTVTCKDTSDWTAKRGGESTIALSDSSDRVRAHSASPGCECSVCNESAINEGRVLPLGYKALNDGIALSRVPNDDRIR